MPQYRPPRTAGVHRIAAIGLFRALLSQGRQIPLEPHDVASLCNIVRNKFKQKRFEQSKRWLTRAWFAGYEALNLFDKSTNNDASSLEQLRDLLHRTPKHFKRPPPIAPLLPKEKPKARPPPSAADSILSRPRPVVSGRRRIPVLTFGNKIPFLRIKKPQPHALGALLRKRERVQMARVYRLEHYENMIATGAHEDDWDRLMLAHGVDIAAAEETARLGHAIVDGNWQQSYIEARKVVKNDQRRWVRKKLDHGMKLLKIVEEEKKLATAERLEKKQEAWKKRMARRSGASVVNANVVSNQSE